MSSWLTASSVVVGLHLFATQDFRAKCWVNDKAVNPYMDYLRDFRAFCLLTPNV
jgi:hypothetical protein